jgi:hypothetical protein
MNATYRGVAPAHSDGGRLAIRALRSLGWLPSLAGAGVGCLFRWLFNLMLGCTHRQKSLPFTPVRRNAAPGAAHSHTYVVCLDCGQTFEYDWREMRLKPPVAAPPTPVRACAPPRPAPITLEPPVPRAGEHRFQSARGRVRRLTA